MNAFTQHLIQQYDYQSHDMALTIAETTREAAGINIMPIRQQALLVCQGPESAKFLQGQLTCDIQAVTPEQSQFGAHCTPKGRALSSFRLALLEDDTYLMGCHHSVQDIILKQLGKYIVFSKATLEAPKDEWVCIGIDGTDVQQQLQQLGFTPKQHTSRSTQAKLDSTLCIQLDENHNSYELWAPTVQAIDLWNMLAPNANLRSSDNWNLCLIEAGVAQVQDTTSDVFIPQMLNFDAINAISFTKGCYTGQEIIARTKYRGQVKRRMIRGQVIPSDSNANIAHVGSPILLDDKEVGIVVLVAKDSSNTYQLLAVVKDSAIESDNLVVSVTNTTGKAISTEECDTETQKLQMLTLPYAIPN